MPCFYTYKYFTEEVNSDMKEYLNSAVSRLGGVIDTLSNGYSITTGDGSNLTLITKAGSDDLTASSPSKELLGSFMQNLTAVALESKLELQGKRIERTESKDGIKLVVTE